MAIESKLQSDISKHFRMIGCIVMKMPAGYQNIPVGFPDLLILAPNGRYFNLEVKASPTAPFQPLQKEYIAKLDAMSYSRAVNPENWDEIRTEIELFMV